MAFHDWHEECHFQHVNSVLHVECAPRPEALRARAVEVIDALWGHEQQPWLYRITADGCIAPKELLRDLQNMAAAVDFGSSTHDCITHYCCVVEGSAEHAAGSRVGSPCCSGRQESVDKVSVALVNWICHRAWDQVAASRWTKAGISLRRVLSGFLAQRVLPECLRAMQTSWAVHEGLAASLARMVAADKDDFSSRQKLRLLRVCRLLCPAAAAVDLVIVFNCLLCAEPLLYDLLGDGNAKKKATLADLCSSESPISKAQARIVERLVAWGAAAGMVLM